MLSFLPPEIFGVEHAGEELRVRGQLVCAAVDVEEETGGSCIALC
jgi:hypothetical protein